MKRNILFLLLTFVVGVARANHWNPNTSQFADYMTVTSVVQINGVEQANLQLELGAFCGDEVRGSKYAQIAPNGRYIFRLPCWGNSGDTFTFRLYDAANDIELDYLVCNVSLTYNQNGYGGGANPFVFNFIGETPVTGFHFITAGNWSNASNWEGGALPGESDEVFIDAPCQLNQNARVSELTISNGQSLTLQSGKTLIVTGTLTNTAVSGLVIKDGAQLINASEHVAATMEKDIIAYSNTNNADGWYTIASPMDAMPIAGSSFLTELYDLYRFDERNQEHNEWENYEAGHDDFTSFENGRGYLYANSNTFSPAFTGTLNATDVIHHLTYTDRPDAISGFNLIGNPFPHVIYKGGGGAIDNERLASGYYTLANEGVWHVHTFEDAIQPGQGILVKTIGEMDLTIAKSVTVAIKETSASKAGTSRLDIGISGSSGQDRAFVYFTSGIGLTKMANFAQQAPSLWIHDNGNNYAIAHVDSGYESLDLYFHNTNSGNFTLNVNAVDTNFNYLQLTDRVTGTTVDLLQHSSYTFHATGHEYEARFVITFKLATDVDEHQQQTFCFVKNDVLHLLTEGQGGQLAMVDVLGRTVKSVKLDGNTCSVADLPSGVYIVRFDGRTTNLVQKVVINH